MSRETKVGLFVALSFLLLVGGVLGYKLYFTGDPWLSLPDGTGADMAQNDSNKPEEEKPPVAGTGKPPEPAPDNPELEKAKKPKKTPEEKALAKANAAEGKPGEGPPPTEAPAKQPEEIGKPVAGSTPTELGKPGEGRPMPPPAEETPKPSTIVATGPSGPPPAEDMPKLGPAPADKPMTPTPMGPPMPDETPKLGGPPAPAEAVKPTLNDKPTGGLPMLPPLPDEAPKPSERSLVGGPALPPPAEEVKPAMEKQGASPPSSPSPPALPPAAEEPHKPQPFVEKPGVNPPPLPPAEEITRTGPPPAEKPLANLPPSPPPPAFAARPSGPDASPLDLAPRLTGPAGSSPLPMTPKDVPPPPPPNTFERKYDAPVLGKPEVARGPASGTLVSGPQDNRPGIPLTVRPQPGKQPRNETGGVPVVIQPPTWNTPDGRAPAQVESFELEVYVMKQGDTYATVSQMRYRSDRYQNALAQFNRERDGRLSSPQAGMSVYLPPAGYLERRYGVSNPTGDPKLSPARGPSLESAQGWNASIKDKNVQPAGGRLDAPPAANSDAKPVVQADLPGLAAGKRYRVRANDTIWSIAKATLGNGERWPDILKLNRDALRDVNQLQAGMVLRLPDDARVDASETAP